MREIKRGIKREAVKVSAKLSLLSSLLCHKPLWTAFLFFCLLLGVVRSCLSPTLLVFPWEGNSHANPFISSRSSARKNGGTDSPIPGAKCPHVQHRNQGHPSPLAHLPVGRQAHHNLLLGVCCKRGQAEHNCLVVPPLQSFFVLGKTCTKLKERSLSLS